MNGKKTLLIITNISKVVPLFTGSRRIVGHFVWPQEFHRSLRDSLNHDSARNPILFFTPSTVIGHGRSANYRQLTCSVGRAASPEGGYDRKGGRPFDLHKGFAKCPGRRPEHSLGGENERLGTEIFHLRKDIVFFQRRWVG